MATKVKEAEEAQTTEENGEEAPKKRIPQRIAGIRKQVLEFQKATFEGTFDAVVAFQDQQEQFVTDVLDRSKLVPQEGKDLVNEWIDTYKRGRDDVKGAVEKTFDLYEQFLDRVEEGTPAEDADIIVEEEELVGAAQ